MSIVRTHAAHMKALDAAHPRLAWSITKGAMVDRDVPDKVYINNTIALNCFAYTRPAAGRISPPWVSYVQDSYDTYKSVFVLNENGDPERIGAVHTHAKFLRNRNDNMWERHRGGELPTPTDIPYLEFLQT